MSFNRHVDEIRSRTSISQTHIIHMRLGLTGIRKTAVQPRALRRVVPAGMGAVLAIALAAMTMTLAACDAGSPAVGAKAEAGAGAKAEAGTKADWSGNAQVKSGKVLSGLEGQSAEVRRSPAALLGQSEYRAAVRSQTGRQTGARRSGNQGRGRVFEHAYGWI
jgi:hypothetical protein